jgi:hypothetical protein
MARPQKLGIANMGLMIYSAAADAQQFPAAPHLQPLPIEGMTPFAIVERDDFPYAGTDIVVVRRVGKMPGDVVMVRRGKVSPRALAVAASHVAALRAAMTDSAASDGVFRVRFEPSRAPQRESEAANWAQMLRTVRPHELDGVGKVRHVVVYMPNRGSVTSAQRGEAKRP